MESYLQKVLRSRAKDTLKIKPKPSLDEEETKYSLKTESINDSVLNDFHESITDEISEGTESNFIQKIPILKYTQNRHDSDLPAAQFFYAVKQNNPELLTKILTSSPLKLDVNSKLPTGESALHIASKAGFVKICEVLLDYSEPQVNIRDSLYRTPFHLSCQSGNLKIVQILARSGADINAIDLNGNTGLHLACAEKQGGVVSWVLGKSPNFSLKNNDGKTAEDLSDDITAALFHQSLKNTVVFSGPSISQCLKEEANRVRIGDVKVKPDMFTGIAQIGKGSFGEVYLVKKKSSDQLFALKVLRKERILSLNLIKYALTERNVLSYIKHPFIVSLKYAFQSNEKLFLVLDYCPGGDLSSWLLKEKRFTEERAKIYIAEILLALEELHKRDIIYRDLKPDNIVIDKDGHALLTDFGLSKEGVTNNMSAKSFCGSVAYLAPEMIKRNGHGKAVDWYLLGVVLYEMLVGLPPYFSSNKEELLNNIQRGKLRIPANLSKEARELIKDLLIRDPNSRLGSNRGAEEVKQHVFFKDIDWEAVLKKELSPPPPRKFDVPVGSAPIEWIFGEDDGESNRVKSWTFVSSEEVN